ncbi:monocarboxylate transporter 5-like isoform X1 [Styela clava]|uniref:monocarboxylate transporter 14-like n=1 Tax=Styela clava TaxID=7725 RepID=UPI001939D8EA|nr:monocarboxylate transporter 14-like [Styela clava]
MNRDQRKWRWVVLIACFFSTMANSTVFFAFGTFVLPWKDEFSASGAAIATVTSCGAALSSIGCPLGSFFVEKSGYRWTHVIGGVMMMISFICSAHVTTLLQMFFAYSILGGFGSSLCHVSYVNAVSEHFTDHQGLAFAIVTSGYGVGGLIFPLLFEVLIVKYTWRGAMIVVAGIFGNLLVCGLLLYPASATPPFPKSYFFDKKDKISDASNTSIEYSTACKEESSCSEMPNANPSIEVESNTHNIIQEHVSHPTNAESQQDEQIKESMCEETGDNDNAKLSNNVAYFDKNVEHIHSDTTEISTLVNIVAEKYEADFSTKMSFLQISKTLLSLWSFYIMVLHNVTLYMGYYLVLGLTPLRASYDLDMSIEQASQLVAAFGINSLSRIFIGIIAEMKLIKCSVVYLSCFATAGALALFSLLAKTFTLQLIYCLLSASLFASLSHYHLLVYEVYDRQLFNTAFGYLEFMHGVGIASGPIIGGLLFDMSGSCVYSFAFAGISILFAVSILPIGLGITGQIKKLNF